VLPLFADRISRPGPVASNSKRGVEVLSLPRQYAVVIKSRRLLFQVPFSDHRRVITCLAHFDWQVLLLGRDVASQVEHAIRL
jgi:hypothetical protein